jgi:hypothetical protein
MGLLKNHLKRKIISLFNLKSKSKRERCDFFNSPYISYFLENLLKKLNLWPKNAVKFSSHMLRCEVVETNW